MCEGRWAAGATRDFQVASPQWLMFLWTAGLQSCVRQCKKKYRLRYHSTVGQFFCLATYTAIPQLDLVCSRLGKVPRAPRCQSAAPNKTPPLAQARELLRALADQWVREVAAATMASQAPGVGQKLRALWNHPAGPKVGKQCVGAAGCRGRRAGLRARPTAASPPPPLRRPAAPASSASPRTQLCPA